MIPADSETIRRARRVAYHCSPRENRPSIAAASLRGTLPGVYLWGTLETAKEYAQWFDDIWEADIDGMAMRPGGPHSQHFNEVWCMTAIPPERLRLVMEAGGYERST